MQWQYHHQLQEVEVYTQQRNARIQQHGEETPTSISNEEQPETEEKRHLLNQTINEADIVKIK